MIDVTVTWIYRKWICLCCWQGDQIDDIDLHLGLVVYRLGCINRYDSKVNLLMVKRPHHSSTVHMRLVEQCVQIGKQGVPDVEYISTHCRYVWPASWIMLLEVLHDYYKPHQTYRVATICVYKYLHVFGIASDSFSPHSFITYLPLCIHITHVGGFFMMFRWY